MTKIGLVALLSVGCLAPAAAVSTYSLMDLGFPGVSGAGSVNNAGQVAGTARTQLHPSEIYWFDGVSSHRIPDFGRGGWSWHISNTGLIVGGSYRENGSMGAFSYSGGTVTDIGSLGGRDAEALNCNDAGAIVGWSKLPGFVSYEHAFSYVNGVMTDLGTFGQDRSLALDVNNVGDVVGFSEVVNQESTALVWRGGIASEVGSFGLGDSRAMSINDERSIAGYALASTIKYRAFVKFNGSASLQEIGVLNGDSSYAVEINNSNQVVGTVTTSSFDPVGFLFEGGVTYDLDGLLDSSGDGWHILGATGISDTGFISAAAYHAATNRYSAVRLSPVPEPSTAAMALLGLPALALGLRGRVSRRHGDLSSKN